MARLAGVVSITTNYEAKIKAPFDARMLCKTKADLTDPKSWSYSSTYVGMLVSVANDPDEANNGVYRLKVDKPEEISSWVKLAGESDFEAFTEQLEEQLSNYVTEEQIAGYTKMHLGILPATGEENTIYFNEVDGNWEQYIWYNDKFVGIGSASIDLSNFYTKEEIAALLADIISKIPTLTSQLTNDSNFVTNEWVLAQLQSYVTSSALESILEEYITEANVDAKLNSKQDTLVSGTNIKTINGQSILGSGNITIEGTGESNPATYDTIGGILATDSGDNTDKSAYVDVESDGKAFVKIPSVDETSTADDVVNLLNTSVETLVLNGNAQ